MCDFMLLTVLVILITHNLNIINDISTHRSGYFHILLMLSVFLVFLVFFEGTKVPYCICLVV